MLQLQSKERYSRKSVYYSFGNDGVREQVCKLFH